MDEGAATTLAMRPPPRALTNDGGHKTRQAQHCAFKESIPNRVCYLCQALREGSF